MEGDESQQQLSDLNTTFNKIMQRLAANEKAVKIMRHAVSGNEDRAEAYKTLKKLLKDNQDELYSVKNQLFDRTAELDTMVLERDQLKKKLQELEKTVKINLEHHRIDKESALTEEKIKHQKKLASLKHENDHVNQKLVMNHKSQIEVKENEIQDLKRKLAKVEGENMELEKKLSSHQCISETCKTEKATQKQFYTRALAELEEELKRAKKRPMSPPRLQDSQPTSKRSKKVTFNDDIGEKSADRGDQPSSRSTTNYCSTPKKTILKNDDRHDRNKHKLFVDKFLPKPASKPNFARKW